VPDRTAQSVSSVLRAVAWSGGLHVIALFLVAIVSSRARPTSGLAMADASDPAWQEFPEDLDVALGPDSVGAFDLAELPPLEPPPRPPLPLGDVTTADTNPRIGVDHDAVERRAAASDSGIGAGRPQEIAWRRDASTLHERISDGARAYRPAREKLSARAASPEQLRQEPVVGTGDSSLTKAARTEAAKEVPVDLPSEEEESERATTPPPTELAAAEAGTAASEGEGPLEAEQGRKSFDATRPGKASETEASRAASSELNPGLLDYSAPSASIAVGVQGRGPGDAPGVLPEQSSGKASALNGGQPIASPIPAVGEGSDERVYAREHQEIRQRVARALRFPRRLAIRLEQGEAIVVFQVERSGQITGEVKLVKSAGFEEFDQEAIQVVRRAAPYPALRKALLVRIRIPFENPVIR
jgi:TonB family protein